MSGATRSRSPEAAERRAALALAALPGVGCATFHELLATFGSAARAFDETARAAARAAALSEADRLLAAARGCGAAVLHPGAPAWPPALADLADEPAHLFTLGDPALVAPPAVAIVGTRSSTAYGERVTRELAAALARAGACIVSGMARGIDAAAHRAALEAGGRTAAVLGTGVDVAYPAGHRALHRALAERGVVLSEHAPGERASAGSFPRRNRIIAALASVTIVVEAGARSGALVTAGHALDLGRTVAAVPGPIDSPQSAGSNELLRDGAVVIASVADALALAGLTPPVARDTSALTGDELQLWEATAAGPADIDTLALRSGLPARRCLEAVTALELAGMIECAMTGEIRRR